MEYRKSIVGGIVLLILAAAGWAFGLFGGTDPAIAKLQDLSSQISQDGLPDAQREQFRDQFRQQMQSLSDSQRRAFFDANRGQWEARASQRMAEFFTMSKSDQNKRLDEILNRMSQPRTQNANARNQNGGGNRGGRNMSEAQREERSKRRIENTSPKQRAQMAAFRKMLDQRAAQRGIKVDSGRGGPGGWRG